MVAKEPAPALLLSLVEHELRTVVALAPEFADYKRSGPGTDEHRMRYVYGVARTCAQRLRKRKTVYDVIPAGSSLGHFSLGCTYRLGSSACASRILAVCGRHVGLSGC